MITFVLEWSLSFLGHSPTGTAVTKNGHGARSPSWASIHLADRLLTARSREVSKQRDLGLDFINRSEIWQAAQQQRCRDAVKFQIDTIIITSKLAASRLHEILR